MKLYSSIYALLILALKIATPSHAAQLWVEGEAPTSTTHIVANKGLNAVNPFELSGGQWLSSFTEVSMPDTGTADYTVRVPASGTYTFWVRALGNWP